LQVVAGEADSIAGIIAHSGACTATAWALRSRPSWNTATLVFISPMASPRRYRLLFQKALGLSDEVMRHFSADTERRLAFRWEDFEVPEMAARMNTPPLLLIHDRDDRETSYTESEAIAAAWSRTQLRLTQGLGHVRILRD